MECLHNPSQFIGVAWLMIEPRFLLPALQIQTVLDQPTLSTRRKALDTMPKKLDDAFGVTIARINNQTEARANQAMEVLKWTLLAERQLTVAELRHALAVTPGDSLDWDNLPSERSLTEWCLGLVVLDKETSSIRLVHKSLSEHLNNQHTLRRLFQRGHSGIAQTCLMYMSFNDKSPHFDPTVADEVLEKQIYKHQDTFCLLMYAIENWGKHSAKDPSEATQTLALDLFLRPSNDHCISRGFHFWMLRRFSYTQALAMRDELEWLALNSNLGLHFVAHFGENTICQALLETQSNQINLKSPESSYKMTPLHIATENSHENTMITLLQSGADINAKDRYGITPFHIAAGTTTSRLCVSFSKAVQVSA
jgi:hypothetical protein